VDKKITLRLEGGTAVLDELLADPSQVGTFDFAYVDADKPNYPLYFEKLALLLKSGGFIMFDNTLWSGKVADPEMRAKDQNTQALYTVATTALNDPRFKTHSIAFSDGLTIAQKL
jgi:caffeoyl-CoA O-methyltransferase